MTGIMAKSPLAAAISPDQNRNLTSETADNQQSDLALKAAKVDAYLKSIGSPLVGYGQKFVEAAVDNGLPPYTIVAISGEESTFGRFTCHYAPHNVFGWNSCHGKDFKSIDEAIDTVAAAVSAHGSNTAQYYKGKTLDQALETYNGKAKASYVSDIHWIVNQIDGQDVAAASSNTNA